MRAKKAAVGFGGMSGKVHLRGESGGVQGDGDAVAGERRNDGGLIADTPESGEFPGLNSRTESARWPAGAAKLPLLRREACAGGGCRGGSNRGALWPATQRSEVWSGGTTRQRFASVIFNEREAAVAAVEEIEVHEVAQ